MDCVDEEDVEYVLVTLLPVTRATRVNGVDIDVAEVASELRGAHMSRCMTTRSFAAMTASVGVIVTVTALSPAVAA